MLILVLNSDYHLFKRGVRYVRVLFAAMPNHLLDRPCTVINADLTRPEWEDPQNKHGGKWAYQVRSSQAPQAPKADTRSLHTVQG